jgi:hypothetical protein
VRVVGDQPFDLDNDFPSCLLGFWPTAVDESSHAAGGCEYRPGPHGPIVRPINPQSRELLAGLLI